MAATATATTNANQLADNPYVQELFGVLKENDKDTAGLTALLSYVKQMESFVKNADGQISEMKSQLDEMKEMQKHPIKTALQSTIVSLEARVTGIKAMLENIKERIVEGCKNAIQAVKDTGVTALDKMADFFHIKQGFEKIQKDCNQAIARCDKSVNQIQQFSTEYHQTGLHLKNMFRIAVGKETVEQPKENGALAKAMCAPYRTEKKCFNSICNTADKAIAKLEDLGKSAAEIRQERQAAKEHKSPAAAHLAEYEAKAKQLNAVNAEKAAEKSAKVIDFKPKDEAAVM